jgi:uncharacterized protein
MSQQNVNVVRSVYDAFDSRDMDGVLAHLSVDVVVTATEGLPWSGQYTGTEGFEEFIQSIDDHVRFSVETEELLDSGASVAQIGRTVGEVYTTQMPFTFRAIHIWTLEEGKIVSFRNYIDTVEQRRALGLSGEPPATPGSREPFLS